MKKIALFTALLATISLAGNTQNYIGSSFTVKDAYDNVFRSYDLTRQYDLIGTYRGWDTTAIYIAGYNKSNSSYSTQKIFMGNPTDGNRFVVANLITGNMGIGVADPQNKLVVGGVAHFLGSDLKLSEPSADRGNPGASRALVHYINNTIKHKPNETIYFIYAHFNHLYFKSSCTTSGNRSCSKLYRL